MEPIGKRQVDIPSHPQVAPWIAKTHGKIKFETTQVASEHGCSRSYLYRFKRADTPNFYYCGEVDNVKHTIFSCTKWSESIQSAQTQLGADLRSEDIVELQARIQGEGKGERDSSKSLRKSFFHNLL